MITAREAAEQTINVSLGKDGGQLSKISSRMADQIKHEQYSVEISEELRPTVITKLQDLGYDVEKVKCNWIAYKISWEKYKQPNTLKDAIKECQDGRGGIINE